MYCFCFSSFSLSVIVVTYIVASFENRPLSFFFFFSTALLTTKKEKRTTKERQSSKTARTNEKSQAKLMKTESNL